MFSVHALTTGNTKTEAVDSQDHTLLICFDLVALLLLLFVHRLMLQTFKMIRPFFYLFILLNLYDTAYSSVCNEAVCASVVSKCMLTQSCKCDLTHCSCCKDCFNCLSYLYKACCSCVDMCPGAEALTNQSKESYMEQFHEGGVPQLFALLTSEPDQMKRWVSVPIAVSDLSLQSFDDDVSKQNSLAENCTVAYMSQCMPLTKCKSSCESMGSAGFRWFRDGCCECIGETCKNYGLDEKRYLYCKEGHAEEEIPEDNLYFGEDIDPQEELS